MDIAKILNESTIFQTSSHGIKFGTRGCCAHCGRDVHTWDTPWISFPGVSIEECKAEAIWQYNMCQIQKEKENESYYCDHHDSQESCQHCDHEGRPED